MAKRKTGNTTDVFEQSYLFMKNALADESILLRMLPGTLEHQYAYIKEYLDQIKAISVVNGPEDEKMARGI